MTVAALSIGNLDAASSCKRGERNVKTVEGAGVT
jgi:hypothetical protein